MEFEYSCVFNRRVDLEPVPARTVPQAAQKEFSIPTFKKVLELQCYKVNRKPQISVDASVPLLKDTI